MITAEAGYDLRVALGEKAVLDGRARVEGVTSSRPELEWRLVARPDTSRLFLPRDPGPRLEFRPDAPGEYRVALTASVDDAVSEPDEVVVTAFVDQLPVAVIDGPDAVVLGARPVFSGRRSHDAEGAIVSYSWHSTLEDRPGWDHGSFDPTFEMPMWDAGVYTLRLTVADGAGQSVTTSRRVVCTYPEGSPTADAGPDLEVLTRTLVSLDGRRSSDPGGQPFHLGWRWVSAPQGARNVSLEGATPSFVPLVPGRYELELVATRLDDTSYRGTDSLVITVRERGSTAEDIRPFDAPVVDAAYSRSLERLVVLTSNPSRLLRIDPLDGSTSSVDLPSDAASLSLAPDGLRAAVGLWTEIAEFDLQTLGDPLVRYLDGRVGDIVHAGRFVLALPPASSSTPIIQSVEMSNGYQWSSEVGEVRAPPAGSLGVLDPGGDAIYALGADPGALIQRWRFRDGQPELAWDAPAPPAPDRACGQLHLPPGSRRLFTSCGSTFSSSSSQGDDLRYTGNVWGEQAPPGGLAGVDERDGQLAWLPGDAAGTAGGVVTAELHLADAETLAPLRNVPLPDLVVDAQTFATTGRFVFLARDRAIVIVRAVATSGLLAPDGLAVIDLRP